LLKRLAVIAALAALPLAAVTPAPAVADVPPSPAPSESPEPEATATPAAGEGFSIGYGLSADPRTWQFGSSVMFRNHPAGDWSEAILGLTSRNQVIEPNGQYAIESTGVNAALGVQAWFLRLGVAAELDWVRRIVQQGGKLSWNNSPGLNVEPYIGTALPFLNTPFTKLDARVYVPLTTFVPQWTILSPDAAYGPRVQLNLWVTIPNGPDDEEEEEGGDEEAPSEEEMETPSPEPTATPAPLPRKPAPKPVPTGRPKATGPGGAPAPAKKPLHR
jgi:hypothetical protein